MAAAATEKTPQVSLTAQEATQSQDILPDVDASTSSCGQDAAGAGNVPPRTEEQRTIATEAKTDEQG
jgi:hypothetical protein